MAKALRESGDAEVGPLLDYARARRGFWFRDRKIVRWQPFDTYDAALKAAGLAA